LLPARPRPRQSELRRRAALGSAELLDALDQRQVLAEILALEARREAAIVVGGEILEALNPTAKEAAAERTVGDEADAELAARGEDAVLRIAAPQRVLALQRRDRMHGAGALQRVDAGLGQSQVTDLPLLHEI